MLHSHPSPLRYPGGKLAIAPLLSELIVRNDLHDGTLIEPFAGGAGASLRLLFDEVIAKLQINDFGSSWNLVAGCKKTRDSLSFWDERINNRTL